MELVDTSDRASYERWLRAEARGFYDDDPSAEVLDSLLTGLRMRRATAVFDDRIAEPEWPVATIDSWPTALTVPGRASVESWAISGVTVASTHRRRGIARALIEAELRTAHRLGCPVAILTVSESTIYGRFGFSPAVLSAEWSVETRRVGWAGPEPVGRVQFVAPAHLRVQAPEIFERARRNSPGEIEIWDNLWDLMFGLNPRTADSAKKLRCIRYDDESGVAQGFAVYKVAEDESDFTKHTLSIDYLTAATDDAYAALWRFILELDLVSRVSAALRSVEEPFVWQLADYRAAAKTAESDHLWLRILDVRAALEGRRFGGPGRFALDIEDPLGFVSGRWVLTIADDGTASVSRGTAEVPDDAWHAAMTVRELSSLYLGGVSATNLVRSGRVREEREGSAAAIDRSFRTPRAPWLSVWF